MNNIKKTNSSNKKRQEKHGKEITLAKKSKKP